MLKKIFYFGLFASVACATGASESSYPLISYSRHGDQLEINVENINRQDVKSVLWDNLNASVLFEKMEQDGTVSVTDTDSGFSMTVNNATNVIGEIGFELINGTKFSYRIDDVPHKKARDITTSNNFFSSPGTALRVTGNVRYRDSKCFLFNCWKPAVGANVKINVQGRAIQDLGLPSQNSVSANSSGKYDGGTFLCGTSFTVQFSYNGKSESKTISTESSGKRKCGGWEINADLR